MVNTHPPTPRPATYLVEPGWFVDSISSDKECDQAAYVLTEAIAGIEMQIETTEARAAEGRQINRDWMIRAKGALRHKKAALNQVHIIRGRLRRATLRTSGWTKTQILVDILREIDPAALNRCLDEARGRYPELFAKVAPSTDPIPQAAE